MKLADCVDVLSRITYKSGWSFHIPQATWESYTPPMFDLVIDSTVPNCYPPHDSVTVTYRRAGNLNALRNEEAFLSFVRSAIRQREQHEADEWLVVDGKRRWNPHRKG